MRIFSPDATAKALATLAPVTRHPGDVMEFAERTSDGTPMTHRVYVPRFGLHAAAHAAATVIAPRLNHPRNRLRVVSALVTRFATKPRKHA